MKHFKRILTVAYAVLSLICYYFGIYAFSIFYQMFEMGVLNLESLVFAILFFIFVGVTVFVIKNLMKTKIARQTYIFPFLVLAFSSLFHVIWNIILKLNWSLESIALLSIIVSTPLSVLLAGFASGKMWAKMKDLVTEQGITILTVIILSALPIIRIASTINLQSTGTIVRGSPVIFEKGNDIGQVNYTLTDSLFEAEKILELNTTSLSNQIVKISNKMNEEIEVTYFVEGFHGDITEIEQLLFSFNFDDGSTIPILSIVNNNIDFKASDSIKISEVSSVSVGLNCATGEMLTVSNPILSFQMQIENRSLSINVGIE